MEDDDDVDDMDEEQFKHMMASMGLKPSEQQEQNAPSPEEMKQAEQLMASLFGQMGGQTG